MQLRNASLILIAAIMAISSLTSCSATSQDPIGTSAPAGEPARTPAAVTPPAVGAPIAASSGGPIVIESALCELTAADNGKTIPLTTSTRTVQITLDGNPTTGYSWTLAKTDGKSLAPKGDVVYQTKAAQGMAGSGGQFVATFNIVAPGKTTITMEYKRPWETTTPAAKTFTITLDVTAAKP